ncbi:peptidoglycan-binding protein [Leclercia adecarboxylata]|uniref:peptidoglycan-binding protein n=1 Tax=Leclercia adecarboxylata TaxID=83655 RepID=UPI002DB58491|nr:peptidoglycan-binding protein [Leclercia adecarboxylata]MEB6379143.1 peptidoglycan-binding protein [Leclercia adecarboxylata]
MYLSHFKFAGQPFCKVTRSAGEFFVPYHQDVFGMLREKSRIPGIIGLFSDDETLLGQFSSELLAQTPGVAVNAFPRLSASDLLYKLNPDNTDAKNRLHAIDAVLRQWHEAFPSCRNQGLVLSLSAIQAMRDNGWEVLGMLLSRAQECGLPLTLLLTGAADQEARLLTHSGLGARVHTRHSLRALTGRECLHYVQAQITHQGADISPFTPAHIRRMQALTKGCVSQLNALAHLALLAAWTERAGVVGARHLRLAAGEVLPVARSNKRLAAMGLLACVMFAACGWQFSAAITAALPFTPPVPARWSPPVKRPQVPVQPAIDREVVNQADAMHQLYIMWGYDASAGEALCQNAGRVNLQCKQGNAPLATLEQEGYPWIGELKTGDHLNYAVVARVGKDTLDLLMNNRTWQVSRSWFTRHATGQYTLLHRLTPSGKEAIGAASDNQDLDWLDTQLSQALNEPETHAHRWTRTLANRTRAFQQNTHLRVDGLAGEETLMQLMRVNHIAPALVTPLTQGETH